MLTSSVATTLSPPAWYPCGFGNRALPRQAAPDRLTRGVLEGGDGERRRRSEGGGGATLRKARRAAATGRRAAANGLREAWNVLRGLRNPFPERRNGLRGPGNRL